MRSAILTGLQPVWMGTFAVSILGEGYRMAPWECTMAEMLPDAALLPCSANGTIIYKAKVSHGRSWLGRLIPYCHYAY